MKIILPENLELHHFGNFYKFLSVKGAKRTLQEARLRFSNPVHFNDPLDCSKLQFDFNVSKNEIINYKSVPDSDKYPNENFLKRHYGISIEDIIDDTINLKDIEQGFNNEQKISTLKRFLQELFSFEEIEKYRVSCFSRNYNTKKSFLMWSHYAQSHKGICIGFNNSQNGIKKNQYKNFVPIKVKYENNLPIINNRADFNSKYWLWTKSNIFNYENEVRLVKKTKNRGNYSHLRFPKEMLFKVIFGQIVQKILLRK